MRSPPGLVDTPRLSSAAGASGESRAAAAVRGGGRDGDERTPPWGFTAPGQMPPPRTSFTAGIGEAVADAAAAPEEAAQ